MQVVEISATSAPQDRRLSRSVASVENDVPRVLRFFLDGRPIEVVVSDPSLLQAVREEELRPAEKTKALLPKWRLKRVVDHVDAHLDRRVTLADMAAVAGLTRMYFAAQFRRTTGMSPHGYLLRRRVERAQELMRDPSQGLAQIALSVGFGTQPHFTTVFKRLVGQTPYRWRQNVELQTPQA